MANQLFANNATTAVANPLTVSGTSLTVTTGTGALFPSPTGSQYFYLTLTDSTGTIEIVKCTSRSVDTFTIVRAQDGTTPFPWATGSLVELRLVRANLNALYQLGSDLGTPSAGNLTNCTNLQIPSGIVGTLPIVNGGTGLTTVGTNGQYLQSTGTGLQYVTLSITGRLLNIQTFTSNGTYTATSGTNFVVVEVIGGGGGGGQQGNPQGGGGGGAGGYARKKITSSFSGQTVTIGSGGAVTATGGTSSFGSLVTATGGSGGGLTGGEGGVGSSGDLNLKGSGGSGGSTSYVACGSGGSGFMGYGGGAGGGSTLNNAGANTGGGGGGNYPAQTGGTGGSGLVVVYEFS